MIVFRKKQTIQGLFMHIQTLSRIQHLGFVAFSCCSVKDKDRVIGYVV